MPRVEAALWAVDRWLDVEPAARATPRWFADVLEAAYVGVHLLVPLALGDPRGLRRTAGSGAVLDRDPGHRFHLLRLPPLDPDASTACPFALPAMGHGRRDASIFDCLAATSIQANTFPSGHAAEAVAAALLVVAAPVAHLRRSRGRRAAGISGRRAGPVSLRRRCGHRVGSGRGRLDGPSLARSS